MSTPTTYDLSAVLRALGARASRAIPSIRTGEIVPTISIGDFSTTFAPESIEARAVTPAGFFNQGVGTWSGIYVQSLAPGGIVIEAVRSDGVIPATFFRADEIPWAGGTFSSMFPIGGSTVISRFNNIDLQPDPPPTITALSGGATWGAAFGAGTVQLEVFDRWWLAPGSFFGVIDTSLNTTYPVFRLREIPQEQGPV